MREVCVLLLLFTLITAAGCSGKTDIPETNYPVVRNPEYGIYQNYKNPPLSFELLDSIVIDLPDDQVVSDVSFLQSDKNSNIYFFDRRQSKLISLSESGTLRWITGQKGKGPGDFENVYSMVNNGEQLFIGNIQGSRIDVFSFRGNFIKSYSTDGKIGFTMLQSFNSQNELLLTSPIWGKLGSHLHLTSFSEDSMTFLSSFEIIEAELEESQNISLGVKHHDDKIITFSNLAYSFQYYNYDGEVIKEIKRDFEKLMMSGMYSTSTSRTYSSFGGLRAPYFFPDGSFITILTWPTNINDPNDHVRKRVEGTAPEVQYKHSIDVFNKEGILLYSFEGEGQTPSIGTMAHVDHNGIIYTTSVGEEAVIYRYKLNVPEAL